MLLVPVRCFSVGATFEIKLKYLEIHFSPLNWGSSKTDRTNGVPKSVPVVVAAFVAPPKKGVAVPAVATACFIPVINIGTSWTE